MAVPATHGISLDELAALNDEIVALVRAGVPLEHGLRSLGNDLPGRLGRFARSLAQRMEAGESLADTLGESGEGFPRVYRAVVAAGIRSGKLSSALEGISTAARSAADLRRVMIVAMIYPLIMLQVALALFAFTFSKTAPVVVRMYELLGLELPNWYSSVLYLGTYFQEFIVGIGILAIVAFVVWEWRSSRASAISHIGMRGIPSVSRFMHVGRMATFADVLAMMVEQQVALDEAVVLAAEASGDRILIKASGIIAERIRGGQHTAALPKGFPPLLGWLLNSGVQRERLAKSLRQTASSYRRRTLNMGNWLTIYLPIILSAGLGGTIAFLYAMIVMAPFYNLLFQLSGPHS